MKGRSGGGSARRAVVALSEGRGYIIIENGTAVPIALSSAGKWRIASVTANAGGVAVLAVAEKGVAVAHTVADVAPFMAVRRYSGHRLLDAKYVESAWMGTDKPFITTLGYLHDGERALIPMPSDVVRVEPFEGGAVFFKDSRFESRISVAVRRELAERAGRGEHIEVGDLPFY